MHDGDELIKSDVWAPIVPELVVTDLDTSVTFYGEAFGFELAHSQPRQALLRLEGAQLLLRQFAPEDPLTTAELKAPFGRGVTFRIEVEQPLKVYEKARAEKREILLPMQTVEYDTPGGETFTRDEFVVADPDGYLLRFTN